MDKKLLQILSLFIGLRLALFLYVLVSYAARLPASFSVVMGGIIVIQLGLLVSLRLEQFRLIMGRSYWPLLWSVLALTAIGSDKFFVWLFKDPASSQLLNELVAQQRFLPFDYMVIASSSMGALPLFIILVLICVYHSSNVFIVYLTCVTVVDVSSLLILSLFVMIVLDLELLGLGIRTCFFVFVGYGLSRLIRTLRQQQKQLEEANQQLRSYVTLKESLMVSQERNRLARELHDTIAHTLSGVAVQLNAVDVIWEQQPQEARALLKEAVHVVKQGIADMRGALYDLRAVPLEDLGLVLAMRQIAEKAAQRSGFALQMEISPLEHSLPPALEQGIYRIVQEAFTNIVNHARAKHVSIMFHVCPTSLTLCIRDDGQGFTTTERVSDTQFGLKGMRERASILGGTLRIESQPRLGTTIELNIEGTYGARSHL